MKRLIIGVSILLAVATTVPALKADAAAVISTPNSSTAVNQLASPISPWLLRVNQTRARPVTVAVSPVVSSQETALNSSTLNSTSRYLLTPFNLVSLANQGYFKSQGIPSYSGLLSTYETHQVSAASLVQSAVATRRLSPQALHDQKYLSGVDTQLYFLTTTH